ncbi:uncharacterized protein LOC124933925 [Impatiens glandulifera]|uniref:uncharacterized protein LOC124933925 n=1 Tax=Impatiens glandulifera TaxID=253017 RepID=UPI001FB093F1|nr:uncharacterized protein LOC124933925 [Impatiens glandulifera]
MKAMVSIQDLIEEVKVRTVYWGLCIFAVTYLLTHTSKSMWMNLPLAVLFVAVLRILFNEVEIRQKVQQTFRQTYLSHLEKKQLSINDSRLSALPPPPKWKKKIDSPVIEAAMADFIDKVLRDFVTDMWYSDITDDKEGPELIRSVVMDVLGEISHRLKEINLVDLLTRDIVNLIGDHIDLFRRNQAAIGVDVMGTLSSEERDERLKHHLMASHELHPALASPESEYKVLQRLVSGLLAVVLRPREAQCPLVRCIAREIVTCLIMQPIMTFASPTYVNELIEHVLLIIKDFVKKETDQSSNAGASNPNNASASIVPSAELTSKNDASSHDAANEMALSKTNNYKEILDASLSSNSEVFGEESLHLPSAEWARNLEAATQRRTEVLTPENLENMWTKGRNYKNKAHKIDAAAGPQTSVVGTESKALVQPPSKLSTDTRLYDGENKEVYTPYNEDLQLIESASLHNDLGNLTSAANKITLKRSNSTNSLTVQPTNGGGGPIISEFFNSDFERTNKWQNSSSSTVVLRSEVVHNPKLRCRVIGAYFEKLGSKSFAVYSIAVAAADNNTWFVKRRYRNFERLHRQLKDIPNYTLHLPPKRIFSSSTEDAFVHQRCIQLDKYLQELLLIANIAEQHEVWDFLSVSSKNYSFGRTSSGIKTFAVNVDDAMDDIVRQFKGVSDGLMRKVVGSTSPPRETPTSATSMNLSWIPDEVRNDILLLPAGGSPKKLSDSEEGDKHGEKEAHVEDEESSAQTSGWHSDNELNTKGFPPRIIRHGERHRSLGTNDQHNLQSNSITLDEYLAANGSGSSNQLGDPIGVPPEWAPPNLSVPMLNLVDKVFQLNRRGWLRRQVFWISKQILQLMMEDAIDDWLLRQIQWLRKDDVIAQGIHLLKDILWPGGIFFTKLRIQNETDDCSSSDQPRGKGPKQISFQQQLENARRASDIKKMLFNGAPSALVSLIGYKQYKRVAKDIYYFLQSTVCLKQLAYAILELVLISIFPEMREVVLHINQKMKPHPE